MISLDLPLGIALEQFVLCPSILPVRASCCHLSGQLATSPLPVSFSLYEVEPMLTTNLARAWSESHKHFSSGLPHIISIGNSPKPRSWSTTQGGTFRNGEDFSCKIHLGSGPCVLAICPCSISWVSALGNCISSNEGVITGLFA